MSNRPQKEEEDQIDSIKFKILDLKFLKLKKNHMFYIC